MTDFQLAGLDSYLLEKIVTKLDTSSYFRMRQTCRGMDEFIRTRRNISIHIDDKSSAIYYVAFDINEPHQLRWLHMLNNTHVKDVEAFYGIRFDALIFSEETFGQFNQLCDFLRKHRITCEFLGASEPSSMWTKEECMTILSIVKPRSIQLASVGSNRYEALFQSKILKQIILMIDEDEGAPVASRLLCTFLDVELFMYSCSNASNALRIIHQLYSQPPANLRKFCLVARGGSFEQRWEEEFLGLGLPITKNNSEAYVISVPNGFSIEVFFRASWVEARYQEGYPDSVV